MFSAKQIQSLNALELDIYNYVIKNSDQVLKLKIRELAEETHVSTSTILRFCNKVGCEGYTEFKILFKQYLGEKNKHSKLCDTHLMLDYFKKISDKNFENKIVELALEIAKHRLVIIVGIGTSGILAKYGARCFTNFGTLAQYIEDPFIPIPHELYSDAIILFLSVSGETREVIEIACQFKKSKSTIISVTNDEINTIAKMSDMSISYYMPKEIVASSVNVTSQVPVLFILETLAQKVHQIKNGMVFE